jgi:hypothetical protein
MAKNDPDARIAKLKDGRTHLAYKAEHVVDLSSELIVAAEIYHADVADCYTFVDSVMMAQIHLNEAGAEQEIQEAVADKGYLSEATLELAAELDLRTYIPEKQRPTKSKAAAFDNPSQAEGDARAAGAAATPARAQRKRKRRPPSGKSPAGRRACLNNRRRMARAKGKRLQRLRSERVERSFAHVCDTGGARRTWLTGLEDVTKRYRLAAAAHNLGRIMRLLFGVGKPRRLQGSCALAFLTQLIGRLTQRRSTALATRLNAPQAPEFRLRALTFAA